MSGAAERALTRTSPRPCCCCYRLRKAWREKEKYWERSLVWEKNESSGRARRTVESRRRVGRLLRGVDGRRSNPGLKRQGW